MRKSLALSALALGATLSLSACGGAAGSSPTAPTAGAVTTNPSTAAAEPVSAKSSRGNIVKKLGEGASITDTLNDNKEVVTFAVNSIKPGKCTEPYAQPVVNGNIVIVDVTVETKPELAKAPMKTFSLSGYDFKYVAPNGTTFNGDLGTVATYSCLPDSATFPSAGMGPGEKITAKVVLDLPDTKGVLVLKAPFDLANGWEYAL